MLVGDDLRADLWKTPPQQVAAFAIACAVMEEGVYYYKDDAAIAAKFEEAALEADVPAFRSTKVRPWAAFCYYADFKDDNGYANYQQRGLVLRRG
jgi:hypothetical protein